MIFPSASSLAISRSETVVTETVTLPDNGALRQQPPDVPDQTYHAAEGISDALRQVLFPHRDSDTRWRYRPDPFPTADDREGRTSPAMKYRPVDRPGDAIGQTIPVIFCATAAGSVSLVMRHTYPVLRASHRRQNDIAELAVAVKDKRRLSTVVIQ